ncbi:hypothetical protein PLESTB_001037900 [Pleodorina starrii]|uniref:ubiquitinyl hydrolase 1 n=1 Tax=Pleodorina starrii TaxID=330485 RepID=A0A9W6BPM4_9CHLO|nr:hypothetical protein PLESTB_001037900 [Pleodorina starrii]GLC63856.1 hypothetical protein PLESTF_000090600 [Pleodorina starrii]
MTAAGKSEAVEVELLEKNASWTVGSIGYLVSTTWWNTWVQYTNYTGPGLGATGPPAASHLQLPGGGSPRPGPISNTDLLPPGHCSLSPAAGSCQQLPAAPTSTASPAAAPNPEDVPLRTGLLEQRDFVVVSAGSWQRLTSWYAGGPAVARRVVAEAPPGPAGAGTGRWGRLALYPLRLEVCYKAGGKERTAVVSIDPGASLATLKARACAALGVAESEVALWDYTGGRAVRSLEVPAPEDESSPSSGAGAVSTTAPMAVEDGTPAAPAADGGGSGGASMDVDAAAGAGGGAAADGVKAAAGKDGGGGGVMGRPLREVPLLEGQLLRLRRTDDADSDADDDEDACGSDNENDTAPPAAGKKKAGKKVAVPAAEAGGAAAVRRASAAGSSRSDGGSGSGAPAPPATARTSGGGGGGGAFGGNRLGNRWGAVEDNVLTRDGQPPGLAGLSNLGNTCFMNSSLQCLAHAVPLMSAFLGGAYLLDLNRTNPLGMKGELAEAFGALMEQLWRGGLSSVTPRSFKAKIGRFAPQFSGYAQHDSQEFLAFLLDGLHEDTNRIKNKPYIEEKDQPGRADEEVAAEAWSNYRARNDSLVVDHFQGLFKSTVDCPQCGFNSVKFDPFMYLSLPLPESRRRVVEVVLVRTDGCQLPTRMALELPSGATLTDMMRAAAREAGLPDSVVSSPESHLVTARPLRPFASSGNEELLLLPDCRMRLADAMEAGGGSSSGGGGYNLRSSANNDSGLVVYYYPDASRGPRAEGLSPVVVHFKRPERSRASSWARNVWCGAPLVLYMPADRPPYDPDRVSKVSLHPGSRYEYEISNWADCPLGAALLKALRPIQRRPFALPPPAAAAAAPQDGAAAPAGGGGGDGPVQPAVAAAPMEEDDVPVAAAAAAGGGEEVAVAQPGTPAWEGGRAAVANAAAAAGAESALEWCGGAGAAAAALDGADSGSELMEGLEPLAAAAAAADAAPAAAAAGGGLAGGGGGGEYGDASMPGTPQRAACGSAEDDVGAAGPAALPAVILAGPPTEEDAGGLGPEGVRPFDMWSAQAAPQPQQSTWADDNGGEGDNGGDAGAAAPLTGPPFSLKLANNKGDSVLWGGTYDKGLDVEHHREFLLLFSEACTAPAATADADADAPSSSGSTPAAAAAVVGPYAAELLDSPREHSSLGEHRRRSAAGPQPVSLDACMTTFLQPERLAESDAWYCPRCKSHVCADKKLDLWSLPEVLVVHLKRFSYTRYSRNKLDTRVDFPLHQLDLRPYVMRGQGVQPVYDLFAVSNHYGSMGGGHYTAYAKLPSPPPAAREQAQADGAGAAAEESSALPGEGDRWYCFDDSHVSAVEPEVVRSPAAYVLFYRRRAEAAADPPGLGEMLQGLRTRRSAVAQEVAAAAGGGPADDGPSARGGGGGGAAARGGGLDLGSDHRPEPDQDQDQGSRGGGGGGGAVSIAAAAVAAQAARNGGDGEEGLGVQGRSMDTLTRGSRDSAAAGGRGGGGSGGSTDAYGDADGAVAPGPSSPTPMSVGNTYGGDGDVVYDAGDYDAFALDGGCGGGGALVQPPGSPAEPDPDLNNNDLSCLYNEVEEMDRDSDVASAGGNDLDAEEDVAGEGEGEGTSGRGAAGGFGVSGLGRAGLNLMSTSPPN